MKVKLTAAVVVPLATATVVPSVVALLGPMMAIDCVPLPLPVPPPDGVVVAEPESVVVPVDHDASLGSYPIVRELGWFPSKALSATWIVIT